jgi:predicted Zn finger-like uncharacterized protein
VYTQCSQCDTVFKLSAEVLRAAGGQVRCGKCGEVFNALARLAEDASTFETGESSLDLETRADDILGSVPSLAVAAQSSPEIDESLSPGVEIASLEVLDGETSMEFTLPPGELDRIFVESKKLRKPALQEVVLEPAEASDDQSSEQPLPPDPPQPVELDPALPLHPESAQPDRRVRNGISGFEVPDTVRRQVLAGIEDDAQSAQAVRMVSRRAIEYKVKNEVPADHGRGSRRPFILWLSGAIAAALLLIVQIAHQGPFGGLVTLFSALGGAGAAPVNLSAYQLRQWGVTGDPAANGVLRVRASILNSAAQLQPFPLLRVTLANRFGSRIGSRDFEPSEYLGKPTARLLAPGERADATLDILDPGKNAEGFEIDVCLRQPDKKIACANDAAPQTKK